jgi:hypothetical protein
MNCNQLSKTLDIEQQRQSYAAYGQSERQKSANARTAPPQEKHRDELQQLSNKPLNTNHHHGAAPIKRTSHHGAPPIKDPTTTAHRRSKNQPPATFV